MNGEPVLARWIARRDVSRQEVAAIFGRIMDGELGEPLIAALLVALAAKGETIEEIAGAVEAMRARARPVPHSRPEVVDTCGTGGDGRGTVNVSTAAAFVAAAGGAAVAKHGNRAISSRSGSADVLAALGVAIEVEPELSARQLDAIGLAFLFAPLHHPAMRTVAPVRRALGVRTVFNLVGPLTNPAGARRQVVGVFAEDRVEPVARVLAELGCDHALVVHGLDGLDEITTTAATTIAEVQRRRGRSLPGDSGRARAPGSGALGPRRRHAGRERRDPAEDSRRRGRLDRRPGGGECGSGALRRRPCRIAA